MVPRFLCPFSPLVPFRLSMSFLIPSLLKTCLPFTSYLRGISILRGFCY
nr:MAG TPA: hypothetical protein [Caudoviricetes sp.]